MNTRVELPTGQGSDHHLQWRTLSFSDRSKRALKASAVALAMALISIPLPGLHFVLVPAFLSLAMFLGFKRIRDRYHVELINVGCPSCQKPLKDTQLYAQIDEIRSYCYECRSQFTIKHLSKP